MGTTYVTKKVENVSDWMQHQTAKGKRKRTIRSVIVPDAVVDTGTHYLCLPTQYIKPLGLVLNPGKFPVQTTNGYVERSFYTGARLSIGDRFCEVQVIEIPDELPALIGVIPLEAMDLMVDPSAEKLVGRHGDRQVLMML